MLGVEIVVFSTVLPPILASCDSEWGHNNTLKHFVPRTFFTQTLFSKHWHSYVKKGLYEIIFSTSLNSSLISAIFYWNVSTASYISISQHNFGTTPKCVTSLCSLEFPTAFKDISKPSGTIKLDQHHVCFKKDNPYHRNCFNVAGRPPLMYWQFTALGAWAINVTFKHVFFEAGPDYRLGMLTIFCQKRRRNDCRLRTRYQIYEDDFTYFGHKSCFSIYPDWKNVYLRLFSGYLCKFSLDGAFQVQK